MNLMTKEIEASLLKAPIYSTENQTISPVLVKFFNPYGRGTWYVVEGSQDEAGEWTFFGLVSGLVETAELGYFSLKDLLAVKFIGRPAIERDLRFSGYAVDKVERKVIRLGETQTNG